LFQKVIVLPYIAQKSAVPFPACTHLTHSTRQAFLAGSPLQGSSASPAKLSRVSWISFILPILGLYGPGTVMKMEVFTLNRIGPGGVQDTAEGHDRVKIPRIVCIPPSR
jgi:hypothetical protein